MNTKSTVWKLTNKEGDGELKWQMDRKGLEAKGLDSREDDIKLRPGLFRPEESGCACK